MDYVEIAQIQKKIPCLTEVSLGEVNELVGEYFYDNDDYDVYELCEGSAAGFAEWLKARDELTN